MHLYPWKKDFAKNIRWLCVQGFLRTEVGRPLDMRNMVALDMSYSRLTYIFLSIITFVAAETSVSQDYKS